MTILRMKTLYGEAKMKDVIRESTVASLGSCLEA